MTLLQPPSFMQNRSDHTAQQDRLNLDGIMTAGTSGFAQAAGVNLVRQQTVAAMSVLVCREGFFVSGTENTHQGMYHGYNDGDITVTIAPSSPSLPRIDIVVAYIQDAFYSTASNLFVIDKVTGTPNASPVAPALPNNGLLLATIAVAANATTIVTANIAINAVRAYAEGAEFLAPSSATYPAAPFVGQSIFDLALGQKLRWNGTIWTPENRYGGPLGWLAETIGPGVQVDCTSATTIMSISFPVISGRRYRVTALANGSQITTGPATANTFLVDDQSGPNKFIAYRADLPVGNALVGNGWLVFQASSTRTATITMKGTTSTAALRVAANGCYMEAEDIGI